MKILLTGARGFVGTHMRATLARTFPDAETIAMCAVHDAGEGFVAVDLLDADGVDRAVGAAAPDVVIHLAGQASVARTAHDNGGTFAVNLGGSLNLALALARHVPAATLLFASSSEVYGASFLTGRVTEASPLLPMNAYAKSKRLAEEMFAAVLPPSARLIVTRPFNHTGVGQREDFVMPSFAGQVARIETGQQQPRLMVGNIDVRRHILDVRDVVAAYVALLEASPSLPSRLTCNVASDEACPLRIHVETLQALSRVPFEIEVDPARLRRADVPVAEGDSALLRGLTGWAPRHEPGDTLRDLLAAARQRVTDVGDVDTVQR